MMRKMIKFFKVVDYILAVSDDITPLALQKILYYLQAFFKVFYGYHLFENDLVQVGRKVLFIQKYI